MVGDAIEAIAQIRLIPCHRDPGLVGKALRRGKLVIVPMLAPGRGARHHDDGFPWDKADRIEPIPQCVTTRSAAEKRLKLPGGKNACA